MKVVINRKQINNEDKLKILKVFVKYKRIKDIEGSTQFEF